jgi:MoxR-like ATPase
MSEKFMSFPYYKTDNERLKLEPKDLTLPPIRQEEKNKSYEKSQDLADAVNVALLIGIPLLVTGEPGTGKTQLAYNVNWQLHFRNQEPLRFETKSTSGARDLFYTYDAIGRFHAAQTAQIEYQQTIHVLPSKHLDQPAALPKDSPELFITYNALGLAILLANDWEDARKFLPFGNSGLTSEKQLEFVKSMSQFSFLREKKGKKGEIITSETTVSSWKRRSVVLIDEIDKAPRDFPNDILNEIDRMFFRVTELGNEEISADKDYRPVVIITSNSEKNLPDAFLRRCAYFHIDFPELKLLRKIVVSRLFSDEISEPKWLDEALKLFYDIRDMKLLKSPATAELLSWLTALRSSEFGNKFETFQNLPKEKKQQFFNWTLTNLTKLENDRKKVQNTLKSVWG